MISALLFSLATAQLATAAGASPAPATPQEQSQKPNKPQLVCRTQDRVGTRLGGKRICYTKERWTEIERDSVDALRDAQRDRGSLPTNGT